LGPLALNGEAAERVGIGVADISDLVARSRRLKPAVQRWICYCFTQLMTADLGEAVKRVAAAKSATWTCNERLDRIKNGVPDVVVVAAEG
jgi:hypothetical protein